MRQALINGFRAGVSTGWWITKMMVPITLGVAILQWLGIVALLARWLGPIFAYVGLGGEAVLVFITGALSNLYSAIAVITTLDMDYRSATILAVMGLICHNMIIETIIQRKSGARPWYMVSLRIVMALVAAWVVNMLLPADYTGHLLVDKTDVLVQSNTLGTVLTDWMWQMAKLLPFMFVLIISLNILQQILRTYHLIHYLTIPLRPVMKVFGLSPASSFLWVVLNTLGLTYGGAVMIADRQSGRLSLHDARMLNAHVAMNHSLLEDTLIYFAIGLPLFWLLVPRILLAIVVVWAERGVLYLKRKKRDKDHDNTGTD